METLDPLWMCDPADTGPPAVWESVCGLDRTPPAVGIWTEVSPHLQKNKQLQEVLLQREAELLRLQEENNNLRSFLGSAFVWRLELKKQTPGWCRSLKRKKRRHQAPPLRVCRNLMGESRRQDQGTSEPGLDLWVLRTLGLKDPETIDTSDRGPLMGHDPPAAPFNSQPMGEMSAMVASTPCSSQEGPVQSSSCPVFSSTPVSDQQWVAPPTWTHPPRKDSAEPAFSMPLSPANSVQTRSFPQGQVFFRRDPEGRWSFTWMPNRTLPHQQGLSSACFQSSPPAVDPYLTSSRALLDL